MICRISEDRTNLKQRNFRRNDPENIRIDDGSFRFHSPQELPLQKIVSEETEIVD
jgi:hypothetical protein